MSARLSSWILIGATIATLGCKKLNSPYCDSNDQCDGGTCTSSHLCSNYDAGTDHPTGGTAGGVGGAAGSKGTGGTPFSCADTLCPSATPICNMAARSCEKCTGASACQKLDSTRPLCE